MENDSIELEFIDRLVDCVIQLFELLFCEHEIISNHFLEIGLSRLVSVDVFVDYVPDVLNGMHIVDSLVLLVVLYASFHLANCTGACAGQARTDLDTFAVVVPTDACYLLFLSHPFNLYIDLNFSFN